MQFLNVLFDFIELLFWFFCEHFPIFKNKLLKEINAKQLILHFSLWKIHTKCLNLYEDSSEHTFLRFIWKHITTQLKTWWEIKRHPIWIIKLLFWTYPIWYFKDSCSNILIQMLKCRKLNKKLFLSSFLSFTWISSKSYKNSQIFWRNLGSELLYLKLSLIYHEELLKKMKTKLIHKYFKVN